MRRLLIVPLIVSACAPVEDGEAPNLTDILDIDATSTVPVAVQVEPLEGNAPLTVTVTSNIATFNADDCELDVLGVTTPTDLRAASASVDLTVTSSVRLACVRDGDFGIDETLVTLSSISNLRATPAVLEPGQATSVSWDAQYVDNCHVKAWSRDRTSIIEIDDITTTASDRPNFSTDYTVECEGRGGPIAGSIHVPVVDVRISAPPIVAYGDDLIISVDVDRQATCVITAEPPIDPPSFGPTTSELRVVGVRDVQKSRDYTVTCSVGEIVSSASTGVINVAPVIPRFDIVDASPTSLTLSWETSGVSSCVLDNGAKPVSIERDDVVTNPFGVESGPVTYTISCISGAGLPVERSISVFWGDVRSQPELDGVKAVLGDVLLVGELGDRDVRFDRLQLVTGSFEVLNDVETPGVENQALTFSSLHTVRGNMVIAGLPDVARLLFPNLRSVASLTISGLPLLTCADVSPMVCNLDPDLAAEFVSVSPFCEEAVACLAP